MDIITRMLTKKGESALKIIYGRAHSGKTASMLEEIEFRCARSEKCIVIVPDQISFRTEQMLAEKSFFGGFAQVLTFTKLAKQTAEQLPEGRKTISACGKTMLMYRAIAKVSSKLKMYRDAANKAGLAPKLLSLAEEFSHLGIDRAALAACIKDERPLSVKLGDLTQIFGAYEQLLSADYADADQLLCLSAAAIENSDAYIDTHIYISGFSDFSLPHFSVVSALEKRAKSVTVLVCADENLDTQGFFAPGALTVRKFQKAFTDAEVVYLPKAYGKGALAHFERGYTKYASALYAHEQSELSVFEGRNPYAEIHFAANEILRLCREHGYRFRDFVVVAGDGDRYFDTVSYIFSRYGIPFFVSAKKSAASHPLALAICSALEIIERGFQHDAVFAYLKSGFSNLEAAEVDFLENYVLATGIGAKHWTKDEVWNYKTSYFDGKNTMDAARADALRRRVAEPLLALKAGIGISKTVKESAQAIYEFMCKVGMREKTDKQIASLREQKVFAAASIYRSTYNGIVHVLEQMASLCGEEKCGVARLRNMLSAGLLGQNQAIVPQRADEVSVTDVAQGRFSACKVMFALGTNTGAFCGFSGSEGILSDADRFGLRESGLEVLPTARHKAFDHRFTVYKTLTAATDKLYICYAASDMDGKPFSVSPVAMKAKKLFSDLPVITQDDFEGVVRSPQEARATLAAEIGRVRDIKRIGATGAAIYKVLKEKEPAFAKLLSHCTDGVVQANKLDKKQVEILYPQDISMSITRLEQYSGCPFSYFMTYMLSAKERKISRIGAPDIGTMVHRALEYFVAAAHENGESIAAMAPARVHALIGEVSGRVTQEMFEGMAGVSKASEYFAKRLRVNLERCVQILVRHIALGKFEPVGSEVHFGDDGELKAVAVSLTSGKKVKIHGVIDRLDKYEGSDGTYYRVIDYKTGSKSFSLDNIANGLDYQLMVYMEAALEGKADKKPAAVMYFKIKEPMLSKNGMTDTNTIASEIRKSMRLDGRCIDTPEILEAMDCTGAVESEVFKLKYNKDGSISSRGVDVCSMQMFSCMAKRVRRSIREVGDALLRGEISILPVRTAQKDACRYCPHKPVCLNAGERAYERKFADSDLSAEDRILKEGGDGDAMDS